MKKILIVILALALFFALASCSSPKDAPQAAAPAETPTVQEAVPAVPAVPEVQKVAPAVQEAAPAAAAQTAQEVPKIETAPAEAAAPAAVAAEPVPAEAKTSDEISVEGSGYSIEFLSAKPDKDYSGNDIVIIKYKFTNNSGASAAFWQVFNDSVSQNGRAMSSEGIILDYSVMASTYENVEQGKTAVCCYAYPLYSETDPIDLTMKIYNYNTATTIASASGRVYIEG